MDKQNLLNMICSFFSRFPFSDEPAVSHLQRNSDNVISNSSDKVMKTSRKKNINFHCALSKMGKFQSNQYWQFVNNMPWKFIHFEFVLLFRSHFHSSTFVFSPLTAIFDICFNLWWHKPISNHLNWTHSRNATMCSKECGVWNIHISQTHSHHERHFDIDFVVYSFVCLCVSMCGTHIQVGCSTAHSWNRNVPLHIVSIYACCFRWLTVNRPSIRHIKQIC